MPRLSVVTRMLHMQVILSYLPLPQAESDARSRISCLGHASTQVRPLCQHSTRALDSSGRIQRVCCAGSGHLYEYGNEGVKCCALRLPLGAACLHLSCQAYTHCLTKPWLQLLSSRRAQAAHVWLGPDLDTVVDEPMRDPTVNPRRPSEPVHLPHRGSGGRLLRVRLHGRPERQRRPRGLQAALKLQRSTGAECVGGSEFRPANCPEDGRCGTTARLVQSQVETER